MRKLVDTVCGRFNIDFEESDEIADIISTVNRNLQTKSASASYQMKTGEIFPTNCVPILKENHSEIEPDLSVWGFPNPRSKGVIINARAETASEKSTFRQSLMIRRCIVPSTGFYEWDHSKKKYMIRRRNDPVLYMAGIYNYFDEKSRFVILTTGANESMAKIHNRMPVILERSQLKDWIFDAQCAQAILHEKMPELMLLPMEQTYEQLSLF